MSLRNLDLEEKATQIIFEAGNEGIFQSDLWKRLGLNSRDGSRIAQRLEDKGFIERRRVLYEGRWTYKLFSKQKKVDLKSIVDAPCIKCDDVDKCMLGGEKSPINCEQLDQWINLNSY
ncbi:MAG: MarR family transcriptional regulator [Candidatus Bathyarchaeia archaeon]